ncbi:MAG: hypothetical protein IJW21_03680 [Clostridia bacterium]|nr:hypothetical protein [Clostridia bacterium]
MNKLDLLHSVHSREIPEKTLCDLGFYLLENTAFKDSPCLFKPFIKVVSSPVTEPDVITERRRIFEDFCRYPFLIEDICEYCERAAEFYLNPFGKTFRTVHDRLKYYLSQTLGLLELYEAFPKLLAGTEYCSETLGGYRQSSCAPLRKELERIVPLYTGASFSVNVNFDDGLKLKSASLNDTENVRIPAVYDRNRRKKDAQILPYTEDSVYFGNNSVIYNVANELKDAMILNLCQNISSLNLAIKSFFTNLSFEVSFYKAAMVLRDYMEKEGFHLCMPKICGLEAGICAKDVYDLGLAASASGIFIAGNDVSMEKGKILIVTGHNRGGKTTFLRSIGMAQIMAQAGIFVPAKEYSCPAYNGIFTHFPSEEDEELNDGKLAEELSRLREDFHLLKGGGLALFNESFATTTTQEGSEIGMDVLRAVRASGSHAVFVTHLMELAKNRAEIGDTLSLTTDGTGSYKIAEGEPQEDIRAYEML